MAGEFDTMGKVTVEIEVSNDRDEGKASSGLISIEEVRRAVLTAFVHPAANWLVLPEDIVQRLGLPPLRKVNTRFGDGRVTTRTVYGSAKLKVLGRDMTVDVLCAPEGVPALLGQIPLEGLDFVVDPRNQRLIPNPEAPDPEMALVDVFCISPQ